MIRAEWSVKTQHEWHFSEEYLFTYNEEERQENKINKNLAKKVFSPKFIPLYPSLCKDFTLSEVAIFWFIDFYLTKSSDVFYFTDKQLADMFHMWIKTVSRSLKRLEEWWLIKRTRRMKWNWWQIRYIKMWNMNVQDYPLADESKYTIALQSKWLVAKSQNVPSNKNKINNNNMNNNNITTSQSEIDDVYLLLSFYNELNNKGTAKQQITELFKSKKWEYLKNIRIIIDTVDYMKGYFEEFSVKEDFSKSSVEMFHEVLNTWLAEELEERSHGESLEDVDDVRLLFYRDVQM